MQKDDTPAGVAIDSTPLLDAARRAFDALWAQNGLDWALGPHDPKNDRGHYPGFWDAFWRGVQFGASNAGLEPQRKAEQK